MPIVPRPTHRHSPIKSYAWREGDCSPAGKRSRAHIASANPPAYIPRYWHNPIPRTRIDAGCVGPLGVSERIEFITKVELYSVSVSDCKIIFPTSWSLLKAQGEKHTDFVASTTSPGDISGTMSARPMLHAKDVVDRTEQVSIDPVYSDAACKEGVKTTKRRVARPQI